MSQQNVLDRLPETVIHYGPDGAEVITLNPAQRAIRDVFLGRVLALFRTEWDQTTRRMVEAGLPEEAADTAVYEAVEHLIENGWGDESV